MAKSFKPGVLTANELLTGRAIFRTRSGNWTSDFAMAEVITDEAHAVALLGSAGQDPALVGLYLAGAATGPDGLPRPTHFREIYRARQAVQPLPARAA